MIKRGMWLALLACVLVQPAQADSDLAPSMPDLNLPAETEAPSASVPVQTPAAVPAAAPKPAPAAKKSASRKRASSRRAKKPSIPVTNAAAKVNTEEIVVEPLMQEVQPVTALQAQPETVPAEAVPPAVSAPEAPVAAAPSQFEPARETTAATPAKTLRVVYNPPTDRDPTLSVDDTLLLKYREEQRLRALEAERLRKIEAEKRRLAELERQRQLELERLRDPSREVRGKIRVNGIIGQEVFIGNKVYTVGKSVLGARIVSVQPDAVVFMYKGQKFTKKVQLQ